MPKFEDLPYLKEKIASIADETEVMKRKGRTPNLVKLPQEEKLEPSESYDELLSDDLLDNNNSFVDIQFAFDYNL